MLKRAAQYSLIAILASASLALAEHDGAKEGGGRVSEEDAVLDPRTEISDDQTPSADLALTQFIRTTPKKNKKNGNAEGANGKRTQILCDLTKQALKDMVAVKGTDDETNAPKRWENLHDKHGATKYQESQSSFELTDAELADPKKSSERALAARCGSYWSFRHKVHWKEIEQPYERYCTLMRVIDKRVYCVYIGANGLDKKPEEKVADPVQNPPAVTTNPAPAPAADAVVTTNAAPAPMNAPADTAGMNVLDGFEQLQALRHKDGELYGRSTSGQFYKIWIPPNSKSFLLGNSLEQATETMDPKTVDDLLTYYKFLYDNQLLGDDRPYIQSIESILQESGRLKK